jgi:hypothetical protein
MTKRTHLDQALDRNDPQRAYLPEMRLGTVLVKWSSSAMIVFCTFLLFSETTRVGESTWSMLQQTAKQLHTWMSRTKGP